MCFNMVVVNYSSRGARVLKELIGLVKGEMRINKHGFSFHAIVDDNDVVLRTLDPKRYLSELENIVGKSPRLLHVHLRLASAGEVNEGNVHMWRVGRYYVSHNGSVLHFAPISEPYLYRYLYQAHLQCDQCDIDVESDTLQLSAKSDTLQLVESSDFINAVGALDSKPGELWDVLTMYGFYGVMFMTSKDEVVAVSVKKPMYIYATRDLLIFVNEPIVFASTVRRFGFKLSLNTVPYTTYQNVIIRYDVKKVKPLFFRPKTKPSKPSKPKQEYDHHDHLWWW